MKNRELNLYSDTATTAANTANVETEIVRFTVPVGVTWLMRRLFRPKAFKLVTGAGAEISRSAVVRVYRQVVGRPAPEFLAEFSYSSFAGLSVAEQGDSRNNAVMTKDLGFSRNDGAPVDAAQFRQDWALIFKIVAPEVVSLAHASAAVTFDVIEAF